MGYIKPPPPPPPPPPTTSPMVYLMAKAPPPPRPNPPLKDNADTCSLPRPFYGVMLSLAALVVFGVAMAHNEHEHAKPVPVVEHTQSSPEFIIHDTPKEFACSRNNTTYADWTTKSVYMLGTSGTKTKWGIVTINSDKPVVVISDSAKNEKCGFVHKSG